LRPDRRTYLVFGVLTYDPNTCVISGSPRGVTFTASINTPNGNSGGSGKWVQIIKGGGVSGGKTCTVTPGLDTAYPYPYTNDSPAVALLPTYTSLSRNENFTIYLMWQPPSTVANPIPIPIGYQDWGFSGSASCNSSCGVLRISELQQLVRSSLELARGDPKWWPDQ
jgi:hypothetical protein